MTDRWRFALTEHEQVLDEYVRCARAFPGERWYREPAAGRWSAAALTLHVADAYRLGFEAASGGAGMRQRVPTIVAFLSRHLILPVMLWRKSFPREAPSPSEVRPDVCLAHALSQTDVVDRLESAAAQALAVLQQPHAARVTHAYFGSLAPYQGLRLLSAHTRHHTIGLRARLGAD